jgi:hypothetical protein
MSLPFHRQNLWACLTSFSAHSWNEVKPLIELWWNAYKAWELNDDFNTAVTRRRMSMRTFGEKFDKQRNKRIGAGEPFVLEDAEATNRFFPNSNYSATPSTAERARLSARFIADEAAGRAKMLASGTAKGSGGYWANRGLDSSAFADPRNFDTREAKYDEGLHDMSASLMNPAVSIFKQIHNTDNGAHFSFMPLAEPEDQRMIYTLIRMAKTMRPYWPEMYALIREYRTKMTRVKLAYNSDMGAGYIAIPVHTTPGSSERKFKLRYGLVSNLWLPTPDEDAAPVVAPPVAPAPVAPVITKGQVPPPPPQRTAKDAAAPKPKEDPASIKVKDPASIKVTPEVYHGRQQAARDYRSILDRVGKNEIVIALRQHAGDFPIYAERKGNELFCYDIIDHKPVPNGLKISESGFMTGERRKV